MLPQEFERLPERAQQRLGLRRVPVLGPQSRERLGLAGHPTLRLGDVPLDRGELFLRDGRARHREYPERAGPAAGRPTDQVLLRREGTCRGAQSFPGPAARGGDHTLAREPSFAFGERR